MRTAFFLLLLGFFQQQTITLMDQLQFKHHIAAGHLLVDVRTPEEFAQGHIEGAQNHNFFAADFAQQMQAYDKQKPLLLYCRSGNRSGKAAMLLDSLGFRQLYDLKGGFMDWTP